MGRVPLTLQPIPRGLQLCGDGLKFFQLDHHGVAVACHLFLRCRQRIGLFLHGSKLRLRGIALGQKPVTGRAQFRRDGLQFLEPQRDRSALCPQRIALGQQLRLRVPQGVQLVLRAVPFRQKPIAGCTQFGGHGLKLFEPDRDRVAFSLKCITRVGQIIRGGLLLGQIGARLVPLRHNRVALCLKGFKALAKIGQRRLGAIKLRLQILASVFQGILGRDQSRQNDALFFQRSQCGVTLGNHRIARR